jgi:TonB-dependent receptor
MRLTTCNSGLLSTVILLLSISVEAEQIEEIIVTAKPIRDSQESAIRSKRLAVNVMDVVAADTIGRMPDQNLADSLGRVPGLAIERDQGQARFINFRGAPFRYTAIAFDGIDIPGAQNGRIPRFDSFPSVITSRIAVNKAITPDMPGEAVAGFVNIETFTPFQYEGFRLSAEAGHGNQELGDEDIQKYNARLSYSNETMGVLGFFSHNRRGRITDNREMELEATPDGILANNLDFRSYRGLREDNAWGFRTEYRKKDLRIFFSTLYSEFIDEEERNQFDLDIADGAAISGVPVSPTRGYAPIVLVQRLLEDGIYENSTFTNTAGIDFSSNEWDVELRLNYTETEDLTDLPIPFSAGGAIAGSYDISNVKKPIFIPFEVGTQNPTDINELAFPVNFGLIFAGELDNDVWKFKADASRGLTLFGRESRIKLGLQYEQKEAEGGSVLAFGGFPGSVDIQNFVTDKLWDQDFNNSIGGRTVDNASLIDAWAAEAGGLDVTLDPDSRIGLDEDIIAFYAMVTTEFDWGDFTWGARLEQTDYKSSGTQLTDIGEVPVSVDDDYNSFLPSAHLNYNLSDDLKLRVSMTTGVSRPTYSELRASSTVDVIDFEIDGGNPYLKEEEAWGGDVSLEWYFAPASIFSAGAFHRQIDNVIYADTITIPDGSVLAPGLIPSETPTTYNSFFNGEDGELTGFEVSLITQFQGALEGLGFSGNITWLDSEFTAPTLGNEFSLPGTSDLIYNASVYFERWGLSLRLNYQFRDEWLSTTENDSLTEYWDEEERLDFSARYELPINSFAGTVTLFANANNLTDFVDVRYVNTPRTPNQVEGFGRRWLLGVRVDY